MTLALMNEVKEYEGNEFRELLDHVAKVNIEKAHGGNTNTENKRKSWIVEAGKTKNETGVSSNKEEIAQSQLVKATERDMILKAEIGDTYKNGVQNIKPNVNVQCCSNGTVCFGENLIGKTKSNWKQVFSYFCFLK